MRTSHYSGRLVRSKTIIVVIYLRCGRRAVLQAADRVELAAAASRGLFGPWSARLPDSDAIYVSRHLPGFMVDTSPHQAYRSKSSAMSVFGGRSGSLEMTIELA